MGESESSDQPPETEQPQAAPSADEAGPWHGPLWRACPLGWGAALIEICTR